MEEDPESKHVCKFCRKSFPNGRSLGGHMRSHISSISAETEEKLNNGGNNTKGGEETGYDLRENPKKTWRFAVSKVQTSEKFCKECGKGFPSWKALFGHMKRHSGKEKLSKSLENDQDSWSNANQKLVMDSQSDNESAAAPNQRRRSRRTARYMPAASNSSLSFVNNPSSSVSEIEQEQEEVAMSLMMLSRDLGTWGGLNFPADSSDNNSACFEAKSSVRTNLVSKIEGKKPISSSSELAKLKKLSNKKLEIGNSNSAVRNSKGKRNSQLSATGSAKNELKNERAKKSDVGCYQSAMEDSDDEQRKKKVNANKKLTVIKRKFLGAESLKSMTKSPEKAELSKNIDKRGKFECTTCNKIFNSYQALGGHKASHRKIKGFSSESSIETDPTTEISKLMNDNNSNDSENEEHEVGVAGFDHDEAENTSETKKSKEHQCPICLKVFSSGQALGGHKRSHLAESSRNFQATVASQEPVEEIRDLLDLNLPAADREDKSSSHADESESYRNWWIGSNHKQEALVGL